MITVKDGGAVEFTRPDWLIRDREVRAVSQLMTAGREAWIRAIIGPFRQFMKLALANEAASHLPLGSVPLIVPSTRELEVIFADRSPTGGWGWPTSLFEARIVNGPAPARYHAGLRHHRDRTLRGGVAIDGWGPQTAAVLEPPPRSNRPPLMALAEDLAMAALRDGVAMIHCISPAGVGVTALQVMPISALIDVSIGDDHQTDRVELHIRETDPAYAAHSRALVYERVDGVVLETTYRSAQPDPELRLVDMRPVEELSRRGRTREIPVVPVYSGDRARPWSAAPPLAAAAAAEVHLIDVETRGEMAATAAPRVFISGPASELPQARWDTVLLGPDASVTPWHVDPGVVGSLAARADALSAALDSLLMLDADATPSLPTDGRTATESRARSAATAAFVARLGAALERALQAAAEITAEAVGESPAGKVEIGFERALAAAVGDISEVGTELDDSTPERPAAPIPTDGDA